MSGINAGKSTGNGPGSLASELAPSTSAIPSSSSSTEATTSITTPASAHMAQRSPAIAPLRRAPQPRVNTAARESGATTPSSDTDPRTANAHPSPTRRRAIPAIAAYAPPVLQASAAAISLATGVLAKDDAAALALRASGATSGAVWAAADLAAELDNLFGNSPRSLTASTANVLGVIAGALTTAAATVPANASTSTGIASASAWLAGAAASAATIPRLDDTFARILQGGGALANGTAAALSELAAKASALGDGQRAAICTIASGALWLAGASLAGGAAMRGQQVDAARAQRAAAPDEQV